MQPKQPENAGTQPWYRRARRWGQTNITEIDPGRYDSGWWREQWRRTRIHGVIVNAGGIVFYYPSTFPEVHRAEYLGERDLFGEIVEAAHADGLAVLARMDSNRVHEPFFVEHPEWCSRDADGNPYRAGELYVTCVNSAYYSEFIPAVLREIAERYRPEGFTDNSYSGLNRNSICYCASCTTQFHDATGHDLPARTDWDDAVFKAWIRWNYDCRVRNWDVNNAATRAAGGEHCLWVGMNSGDFIGQGVNFRDSKRIFERSQIVMADHQSRPMVPGFRQNGEAGKLIHGLLGWDKLIPESMAMYQHGHGQPVFRVASKPEPEVRLWAIEGFAGSIQPWWHHIGAYHDDRRQYRSAAPLFEWHEKNEDVLFNRTPVASVGVVWSQENTDFYGRDDARVRVALPFIGATQALTRARIPYLVVHADQIAEYADRLTVLVLPNVGALSDAQCGAIRAFVSGGGSIVATGETGLYDEWGTRRAEAPLADVLGVASRGVRHGAESFTVASFDAWHQHSYLRLAPGESAVQELDATPRHAVLAGFDETDLLPFGGALHVVEPHDGTTVLATFVPPFPIYPPETSWMRVPSSSLPALTVRETEAGGRVVYLAADIDRTYGRDNLPDHFRLLENALRWAANGSIPIEVRGAGYLDCHLYEQPARAILHIVNLTNTEAWRGAVHELIPVGPIDVSVRLPGGSLGARPGGNVDLRVAGGRVESELTDGAASFTLPTILDHEVIVVT